MGPTNNILLFKCLYLLSFSTEALELALQTLVNPNPSFAVAFDFWMPCHFVH